MVFHKRHQSASEQKAAEQQKLGAMIESMYDTVRPDRGNLYRMAFLKGLIGGLGGIVGATVGIAVLLWLLSLFGQIPLIGHFVDSIRHTLQSRPR
jgi:branched-subunit amino acid ABC-type transport system permease component